MTLYATGCGQTAPGGTDGQPVATPIPKLQAPVQAFIGTREADVLYAGPAPGMVGVEQINIQLPGIYSPPGTWEVKLKVSGVWSRSGVTITID